MCVFIFIMNDTVSQLCVDFFGCAQILNYHLIFFQLTGMGGSHFQQLPEDVVRFVTTICSICMYLSNS